MPGDARNLDTALATHPSDLPARAGPLRRLHLFAGSWASVATDLLRPRLTLGVRLAAFDADGRVCLVRHSYVPGLYLPGGGVEEHETCREAAMREAAEEGGLAFTGEPELFNVYRNARPGRRDHVVLFVARNVTTGGSSHQQPGEIVETGFFEPGALPEDATEATRARIAEILGRRPRSDTW